MSEIPKEPILKSARRELVVAALVWFTALVWSVGYCANYGYNLKPEQLKFVLGFPDWIFWGVVLPWWICTAISGIFAFGFMQDADLGEADDSSSNQTEGDNAAQ